MSYLSTIASDIKNHNGKNVLSKDYYDSSEIIDLDWCQKLLKKHKEEYCDPYLIWNLISLQIFLRKYKF